MARKCRLIDLLLAALCLCLLQLASISDGRELQSRVSHVRKVLVERTTDPKDVRGIIAIVTEFQVLMPTPTDPCLPTELTWIQCSNDPSPRITAIYLDGQNLFGSIPDFSMMDALETIDMHGNLLTGNIPSFLGTLPNLQELNLAYNLLVGYVPASIQQNEKLKANFTGNDALFQLPPPQPQGMGNVPDDSFGGTTDPAFTTTYTYAHQNPNRKNNKGKLMAATIGGSYSTFGVVWAIFGAFAAFRHKAKIAAAVAGATTNATETTTEETLMNAATTPSYS